MVTVHGLACNSQTFPTRCRLCRSSVYFFTCDCGSRVFFDELGHPWPLHVCLSRGVKQSPTKEDPRPSGKTAWDTLRNVEFSVEDPKISGILPGFIRGTPHLDVEILTRVKAAKELPRETIRIDPISGRVEVKVGLVQNIQPFDPDKRRRAAIGAIGESHLHRAVGGRDVWQCTLLVDEIDSDPSATDVQSYTILFHNKAESVNLQHGDIIQASIKPTEILGLGRKWVASRIECLM